MKVEVKVKVILPLIGIFGLVALYLTWEWDLHQIMLLVVSVFFVVTPLMKWETMNRIGERLSRAFF